MDKNTKLKITNISGIHFFIEGETLDTKDKIEGCVVIGSPKVNEDVLKMISGEAFIKIDNSKNEKVNIDKGIIEIK